MLHHQLEKADAIMILGNHDPNVAIYGAELFLEKWAPYLIITGGVQHPPEVFNTPEAITEAVFFSQLAVQKGVPQERIIIETLVFFMQNPINIEIINQQTKSLTSQFGPSSSSKRKRWDKKKIKNNSHP